MKYLDFDLEINHDRGREYHVTVRQSPAGEARVTMHFPFDEGMLRDRLKDLQIALLSAGNKHRRIPSMSEQSVQLFGKDLFNALFTGEARNRYDVSREQALMRSMGLRLKLRILVPELAALPWEFLYDSRYDEYLCLSRETPIVRYQEISQSIQPLSVKPPLNILGMVASPIDQVRLDIEREKRMVQEAVNSLEENGLVRLVWLDGTWRQLQRAMQDGSWHIFHFIGHGGFDSIANEGIIILERDNDGKSQSMSATQLRGLLRDNRNLRLVLLNSCEGARSGERDIFSSTAATLARNIPAVLAMQYDITDRAAIEFARTFYEAVANVMPVDAAVAEARKAVSLAIPNTLEWGTPVLFMRSPDGVLFDMTGKSSALQKQAKAPVIVPPQLPISLVSMTTTPSPQSYTNAQTDASDSNQTALDSSQNTEEQAYNGEKLYSNILRQPLLITAVIDLILLVSSFFLPYLSLVAQIGIVLTVIIFICGLVQTFLLEPWGWFISILLLSPLSGILYNLIDSTNSKTKWYIFISLLILSPIAVIAHCLFGQLTKSRRLITPATLKKLIVTISFLGLVLIPVALIIQWYMVIYVGLEFMLAGSFLTVVQLIRLKQGNWLLNLVMSLFVLLFPILFWGVAYGAFGPTDSQDEWGFYT